MHLVHEAFGSGGLADVEAERLAQVVYVVVRLQLRDAGGQHHVQQVDEQVGVRAHNQVRLAANVLEARKVGRPLALALAQRVHKV